MQYENNYSGLHAGGGAGAINLKSSLEDFLKEEYTEGLRSEFAVMDALINNLSKDTITGRKKYKTFQLGITDNVRAVGKTNSDLYNLGLGDFMKAPNTVDAEFDTTKLLGAFSITDETLMKSSTDGSLFDVLGESLNAMQVGLKHTMNRYTYGSSTGLIGRVTSASAFTDKANANPGKQAAGNAKIPDVKIDSDTYNPIIRIACTNSMSILPGMGILLKITASDNSVTAAQGYVWQRDDSTTFGVDSLICVIDASDVAEIAKILAVTTGTPVAAKPASGDDPAVPASYKVEVFSRQLDKTNIIPEYTGLEDIVIKRNNKLFGVDRSVYPSLNCIQVDKNGDLLLEADLRDMSDQIALSSPEGVGINMVCAKHTIISTIEKQMYQFKHYSMDASGNGFQLGGRPNIMFDTFELKKDKYARDKNVYMLDTGKVGELIRKDFDWITNGREGVLERRPGTEIYEAIMTKYADMYIDAWKAHASFINVADAIGSAGLYSREVKVTNAADFEKIGGQA